MNDTMASMNTGGYMAQTDFNATRGMRGTEVFDETTMNPTAKRAKDKEEFQRRKLEEEEMKRQLEEER